MSTSPRNSLTDSPWFWLLVFANAALVLAVVIGPKYAKRQAVLERRFETRQDVARRMARGEAPPIVEDESDEQAAAEDLPEPHIVPLRPLLWFLIAMNFVAMSLFSWRHRRQSIATAAVQPTGHDCSPPPC